MVQLARRCAASSIDVGSGQPERAVRAAVEAKREATGLTGRALDQAIRELMLLEASDWAFMVQRGGFLGELAGERIRDAFDAW